MLTPDVLAAFRERGFVTQPRLFAFEEIGWVRDEARVVSLRRGETGRTREDDPWAGEAPAGTIYGAHRGEAAFRKLAAHPRIVAAARDLMGDDVYVHQSRLVPRFAEPPADALWRRDFDAWSRVDGMPAPRALTAAIVLGDAGAQEPVLHVLAGSHRAPRRGDQPLALAGPVGSVVFYHADLVYAFNRPGDRRSPPLCLVSYNAISNPPARARRDEAFASRPAGPVVVEADDCMWPTAWCAAG